jgi:Tfp pilus assembly protein PilV
MASHIPERQRVVYGIINALFKAIMIRNKSKTNLGFTVIEVLISLFIVGMMLVVFATSLNTITLAKTARYQDLALRIANSKMEELRSLPYNQLPTSGTFTHALLSNLPSGQATQTIEEYNDNTQTVTVSVTWIDSSSQATKQVTLTTLINQWGI